MMKSNVIIKICCFVLFLTGYPASSILVGDERKEGKPDPRTEELEWITHFAPSRPRDEIIARQVGDSLPNSLCPSGITGQFPYPPDCKRFINCWKGRGMIQVCAPGTLFNPATGECDFPDKVKCVQGDGYASAPQPLVTRFPVARPPIAPNQRYSRREKDDYRRDVITVRPNPGRPPYFGPSHLTRPTPRPTSPTRGKLQQKVECPPGFAGLHPHPTDCTRFLNCWGGRMFIQKCGPGTYFNPDMSVCDHAGAIGCAPDDLDNIEQGVQDEELKGSPEEESQINEDYKGTKPSEIQPPTEEELYNAATNLFDVRSGAEEDIPEPVEQASAPKKEELDLDVDEKKERDPSWGKILNFGNDRRQQEEGKLFYDAHGNPVNSKQFLTENGKTSYNNWKPQQQPEFPQPHHNPTHPQKEPGESNVYYLRPHNHVMNQHPPHLQNNPGFKTPVYHNPQSYPQIVRTQTDYPPAQNPYQPSAPVHTVVSVSTQTDYPPVQNPYQPSAPFHTGIPGLDYAPVQNQYQPAAPFHTVVPGHFILVSDKVPVDSRVTHDRHQTKEAPPTFLVPPRQDFPFSSFEPTQSPAAEAQSPFNPEEPSRVLLPPLSDDLTKNQQTGSPKPNDPPVKFNYGGWKPFYNEGGPVYRNSSETPRKEVQNPISVTSNNRGIHHNQGAPVESSPSPVVPNQAWWIAPTENVNLIDPKDEIVAATTYRPSSQKWPVYHGNKNPYRFSTRTSTTATPTTSTEPTTTTRAYETPTATNRIYVVYPVKNYEIPETSEGSFHGHRPHETKIDSVKHQSYESPTKSKSTNPKKASEDDLKKRIKSELDFTDSQEDLDERDVEMYSPNLDDLIPNAGKEIRLKPLSNHLDGYIEMKKPNGEWGLVCDRDYGWMINEANVACRELGYGRGAQISWQGYPLDSSTESIPVSVKEITCNGNEESLKDCRITYDDNSCDITKNAVGLRCFDNVTTQCHPEEVEFNNSCYRIVKRDDLDDAGLTLEESAEYCKKIGGRLTDVISQEENDFISQWMMDKHPEVRSVLTGGIGSAVMGRSLWMWYGSQVPMIYQNWWRGWADEKKIKHGTVHEPSCVVLRKSYPCFIQNEDEAQYEVELGNVEPEYCSANYFYWDVEQCKNLKELKMPHICKKPLEEIGCVVGRGEDYSGTASVTSSGLPCLPWDHPEVKEKLAHRITLQEWSTKLSGHNFCRNMGRQELHPWCFVEGKENSEYCSIPQCWDSGKDQKFSLG